MRIKFYKANHWWNINLWLMSDSTVNGWSRVYNVVPIPHFIKVFLCNLYLAKQKRKRLERQKGLLDKNK